MNSARQAALVQHHRLTRARQQGRRRRNRRLRRRQEPTARTAVGAVGAVVAVVPLCTGATVVAQPIRVQERRVVHLGAGHVARVVARARLAGGQRRRNGRRRAARVHLQALKRPRAARVAPEAPLQRRADRGLRAQCGRLPARDRGPVALIVHATGVGPDHPIKRAYRVVKVEATCPRHLVSVDGTATDRCVVQPRVRSRQVALRRLCVTRHLEGVRGALAARNQRRRRRLRREWGWHMGAARTAVFAVGAIWAVRPQGVGTAVVALPV